MGNVAFLAIDGIVHGDAPRIRELHGVVRQNPDDSAQPVGIALDHAVPFRAYLEGKAPEGGLLPIGLANPPHEAAQRERSEGRFFPGDSEWTRARTPGRVAISSRAPRMISDAWRVASSGAMRMSWAAERMAETGPLSSWLRLTRKSLLARAAASASSLAVFRRSSRTRLDPMSSTIATAWVTSPSGERTGDKSTEAQKNAPVGFLDGRLVPDIESVQDQGTKFADTLRSVLQKSEQVLSDDVRGRMLRGLEKRRIDVIQLEGPIGHADASGQLVHGLVKLAQGLFALAAKGYVPDDPDGSYELHLPFPQPVLSHRGDFPVRDDGGDHLVPHAGSGFPAYSDFQVLGLSVQSAALVEKLGAEIGSGRHALIHAQDGFPVDRLGVRGMQQRGKMSAEQFSGVVSQKPHGVVDEAESPSVSSS
jgi:hypothetical protein